MGTPDTHTQAQSKRPNSLWLGRAIWQLAVGGGWGVKGRWNRKDANVWTSFLNSCCQIHVNIETLNRNRSAPECIQPRLLSSVVECCRRFQHWTRATHTKYEGRAYRNSDCLDLSLSLSLSLSTCLIAHYCSKQSFGGQPKLEQPPRSRASAHGARSCSCSRCSGGKLQQSVYTRRYARQPRGPPGRSFIDFWPNKRERERERERTEKEKVSQCPTPPSLSLSLSSSSSSPSFGLILSREACRHFDVWQIRPCRYFLWWWVWGISSMLNSWTYFDFLNLLLWDSSFTTFLFDNGLLYLKFYIYNNNINIIIIF